MSFPATLPMQNAAAYRELQTCQRLPLHHPGSPRPQRLWLNTCVREPTSVRLRRRAHEGVRMRKDTAKKVNKREDVTALQVATECLKEAP